MACSMVAMAIPEIEFFWRLACSQFILMQSPEATNSYGSRVGEFEGIGSV